LIGSGHVTPLHHVKGIESIPSRYTVVAAVRAGDLHATTSNRGSYHLLHHNGRVKSSDMPSRRRRRRWGRRGKSKRAS
jgi:hypothetical protein